MNSKKMEIKTSEEYNALINKINVTRNLIREKKCDDAINYLKQIAAEYGTEIKTNFVTIEGIENLINMVLLSKGCKGVSMLLKNINNSFDDYYYVIKDDGSINYVTREDLINELNLMKKSLLDDTNTSNVVKDNILNTEFINKDEFIKLAKEYEEDAKSEPGSKAYVTNSIYLDVEDVDYLDDVRRNIYLVNVDISRTTKNIMSNMLLTLYESGSEPHISEELLEIHSKLSEKLKRWIKEYDLNIEYRENIDEEY